MEKRYLCGQELETEGEGERCRIMGGKEGRRGTAGDSYCLPMSVSAENLPAINMLKAGEQPEQAEREREGDGKQARGKREQQRGEKEREQAKVDSREREREGSWRKGNVISQSTAANED